MAQRYTTFIPGYVFNIFEPSIYARKHMPIYILYYYNLLPSEPILRKNFSEQSAQCRIEPKGPPHQYFMN